MRSDDPTVSVGRIQLDWLLRFAVAGALVGLSEPTVEAAGLLRIVGGAEIALGVIVLVFPVPALLLFLAAWKLFTELLRPAAGELPWEVVERASNILAPLVLLYVRGWPTLLSNWLWPRSVSARSPRQ